MSHDASTPQARQPASATPEELRTCEIRYRRLFEAARDGILILDGATCRITDVNPFMVELLGYTRDEFLGKELWQIGLLQDEKASAVAFETLRANGYIRYEDLPLRTKWGQRREVEFVSNIYMENERQVIQCNIRDITERKQAQRTTQLGPLLLLTGLATFLITCATEWVQTILLPLIGSLASSWWANIVPNTLGIMLATYFILRKQEMLYRETLQAITGRKRAEARTERQLRQITALRSIDLAIASSQDLCVTLNVLLDQVTAQLKVDAVEVLLLNQHTQMLEHVAGRGFRSPALQHTRLKLGESHAGQAALERRTLHVSDLLAQPGGLTRAPLLADESFVTYFGVPLIAKGQVQGVLEIFQRTPLAPDPEWLEFLEALAGQAAIALDNATLFENLQRSNTNLALAYDTTIEGWSRALDLRDKETEGHSIRVTAATLRLACALNLTDEELVHIRRGALLHDIGKMGIPDNILLKPGPLTDEEWVIMRRHPVYAFELLSPIDYLRLALDIPYCHHEKWDGSGYPRGLKGEQIPLCARIFAVIDVWDALRSDRPYRQGWPVEKVREHIGQGSGTHFDPQVARAFQEMEM